MSGQSNQLVISVIIPYYNKYTRLLRVLDALDKQTIPKESFEVIIVDDGSQVELSKQEKIKEYQQKINMEIIRNQNNGRSKARNTGIENAKADLLAFLDDDVVLPDYFLERHIQYHANGEKVFVHSKVIDDYQMYFEDRYCKSPSTKSKKVVDKLERINKDLRKVPVAEALCDAVYNEKMVKGLDWVGFITNNVSVSKADVISESMFLEEFSSWGCEDYELGYRLCLKGYKMIYDDLLLIHSPHNMRTAESIRTSFQKYYLLYQDYRITLVEQYFLDEITQEELIRQIRDKEKKINNEGV
jgi:glycosyltransferase involved in cell wall biosynthesis